MKILMFVAYDALSPVQEGVELVLHHVSEIREAPISANDKLVCVLCFGGLCRLFF